MSYSENVSHDPASDNSLRELPSTGLKLPGSEKAELRLAVDDVSRASKSGPLRWLHLKLEMDTHVHTYYIRT